MLFYCHSAQAIDYSYAWPPDQLFHFLVVFKGSAIAISITRTLFIFLVCAEKVETICLETGCQKMAFSVYLEVSEQHW